MYEYIWNVQENTYVKENAILRNKQRSKHKFPFDKQKRYQQLVYQTLIPYFPTTEPSRETCVVYTEYHPCVLFPYTLIHRLYRQQALSGIQFDPRL